MSEQIDTTTKLIAGSRYFLSITEKQVVEIYYSNPKLIISSGPMEQLPVKKEELDLGFRYGSVDGQPNVHPDYMEASRVYKEKIEELLKNNYVEVNESEFYPESIKSLSNKLNQYNLYKSFWLPKLDVHLNEQYLNSSHFGGASYFKNQEYPKCKNCNETLAHLIQINLKDLPDDFDFPFREGIVKTYYCLDEKGDCNLHDPQLENPNQNYLCIYIPPGQENELIEYSEFAKFPIQVISNWVLSGKEFPDGEQVTETDLLEDLDLELSEFEEYVFTFFMSPNEGDKLGGWPLWASFADTPECRLCSSPMEILFHLDPQDHIPFTQAEAIGRIFMCPQHQEEIFFTYYYF